RSHNLAFVKAITAAYQKAFRRAAAAVHDHRGRPAKVRFQARRDYYPFRLKPTSAIVKNAEAAAQRIGLKPALRISNGGLDANWLVRHGIATVTIGAGQNNIHRVGEYVDLEQFAHGCRMALSLATLP